MLKYERLELEYIDHMGTDKSVVNAARVSFANDDIGKEFDVEKDPKLIAYLAKHNHWSPFAHTSICLRVSAPIFVARQMVKHQVGGVWNEVSRRYVSDEPTFFSPDNWRGAPVNAKQGSTGVLESPAMIEAYKTMNNSYVVALESYNALLKLGVAPEQARMVLPTGCYTQWYWTGSLVFWQRVCKLRLDGHSQGETTDTAKFITPIMEKLFPVSWAALMA